jgi:hypothetical protein
MRGAKLEVNLPPEPAARSVVLGEQTGLVHQRIGDEWMSPGTAPFSGCSWLTVLDREGSVTVLYDSGYDGPTPEIIAAAESERETWRAARAQLAQALGTAELDMTWPDLLEMARGDQVMTRGVGR